MTPLAFVAGLALSLTWKREPEYEPFVEPWGDV